jgi:hypothetical protein
MSQADPGPPAQEGVNLGGVFNHDTSPPSSRQAEVVVGDRPVDEWRISRRHCQALWDSCRVWVHDLGSTYGTWLNSDRYHDGIPVNGLEGSLLRLGEVIYLGGVRLRLGTPSRVEAAWLARQGGLVEAMARQADEPGDFGALPVLAGALEEAGCTDAGLLAHLRSGGGHLRGCWAVDLLLGKS